MKLITYKDIKTIILYIGLVIIISLFYIQLCVGKYSDVAYCIYDVMCFVEHNTKAVLIPCFLIMLFYLNRDYFRISYMVRYKNIVKWQKFLIARQCILSFIIAIVQTIVVFIAGIYRSQMGCTWERYDGNPYKWTKLVTHSNIADSMLPILFFLSVFMTMFVTGIIFIVVWSITELPVAGYVFLASLAIVEHSSRVCIFYQVIDMDPIYIYLNGFEIYRYTLYPFIIGITVIITGMFILKRKNFYRFY